MSDSTSFSVDEKRQREEQHIERDLARIRELRGVVSEFHRRAEVEPAVWKDRQAAREAFGAAREARDIEHEVGILYLSQVRRVEGYHRALAAGQVVEPHLGAEPVPPDRVHFAQALYYEEGFDHEIEQLRPLGTAPDLVRRVSRERRARLRWLLTILAQVQPEAAQMVEDEWERMRNRLPGQAGPRIERWERRTGNWLASFLEPLLPE
jgi:hypothetical protein